MFHQREQGASAPAASHPGPLPNSRRPRRTRVTHLRDGFIVAKVGIAR